MAFDIYTKDTSDAIQHGEEYILRSIEEKESTFPKLVELWNNYYDDPQIEYQFCLEYSIEFLELSKNFPNDKFALGFCNRMALFFIKAYKSSQPVRCVSD